jgi:hypothetical protein
VDVEAAPPLGEACVTVRKGGGAEALPLYRESPAAGGTRVVPGRWRAYVMPASADQEPLDERSYPYKEPRDEEDLTEGRDATGAAHEVPSPRG